MPLNFLDSSYELYIPHLRLNSYRDLNPHTTSATPPNLSDDTSTTLHPRDTPSLHANSGKRRGTTRHDAAVKLTMMLGDDATNSDGTATNLGTMTLFHLTGDKGKDAIIVSGQMLRGRYETHC